MTDFIREQEKRRGENAEVSKIPQPSTATKNGAGYAAQESLVFESLASITPATMDSLAEIFKIG